MSFYKFFFTSFFSFIFLLCSEAYGIKASFAFNSGYINAPYTNKVDILTFKKAIQAPEEVIAVTVGATEENLQEIVKLSKLKFLYLDETFTKDSYYLSAEGIETFFTVFSKLPELEYISLCDSRLLPYLKHLPKLKGLKIKQFDWNSFQQNIDYYTGLEVLVIEDSKATRLPNVLGRLTSLVQLDLHVLNVNEFPDLAMLGRLVVLQATIGKITALPPTFITLENLKYLKITGLINFKEFPIEICSLKSLEELHIEVRNAYPIPEKIGKLTNLRLLYLYDCNNLDVLPTALNKLSMLQELHLSDTHGSLNLSALKGIDHPFLLLLNRCNYVGMAKQLIEVPNLKALVIPESTFPEIVKKIEKYLPPEKILKRNFTL